MNCKRTFAQYLSALCPSFVIFIRHSHYQCKFIFVKLQDWTGLAGDELGSPVIRRFFRSLKTSPDYTVLYLPLREAEAIRLTRHDRSPFHQQPSTSILGFHKLVQSWKMSEFYKICIFLFTWVVKPWGLSAEKGPSRRKKQVLILKEVHAWFWGGTEGIRGSSQQQEWANQGGNDKFRSRRQIPAGPRDWGRGGEGMLHWDIPLRSHPTHHPSPNPTADPGKKEKASVTTHLPSSSSPE